MSVQQDDRYRDWDAAYVLGALPADERLEYERHLATCDACRTAVAELAGMPGLLGRLTAGEAVAIAEPAGRPGATPTDTSGPAGGPATTPDGLAHVARRARVGRRRRRTLALVTAGVAVVAAVLGGMAVGATGPRSVDAGSVPAVSSTPGPGTGAGDDGSAVVERYVMTPVSASALRVDLDVTGKAWGTRLDWGCSYGGRDWSGDDRTMYDLVVTRDDGSQSIVATWSAAGTDASDLAAATDIPLASIRSVEVRLHGDSRTLARTAI